MDFLGSQKSFFSVFNGKYERYVKNQKDNSTGNCKGGTYFAFILSEVFNNCPDLVNELLKLSKCKIDWRFDDNLDNIEVVTEGFFEGNTVRDNGKLKNRYADVAVSDADGHSLYIELKWNDDFHDTQPQDYLKDFKKKEAQHKQHAFIFLTKSTDVLEDKKYDKIRKKMSEHHVLLTRYYEAVQKYVENIIRKSKTSKQIQKNAKTIGIIKLLLEFLEENVMNYETEISGTALIKFMEATCGWRWQDGFSQSKSKTIKDSMPQMLYALLNNVNLIAKDIYDDEEIDNKFCLKGKKRQFGVDDFSCLSRLEEPKDFKSFDNCKKMEQLQKEIKRLQKQLKSTPKFIGCEILDETKYSKGGDFIVYHRFPSTSVGYLTVGFRFSSIYRTKNGILDFYCYCQSGKRNKYISYKPIKLELKDVNGKKLNGAVESSIYLPDKETMVKNIKKMLLG